LVYPFGRNLQDQLPEPKLFRTERPPIVTVDPISQPHVVDDRTEPTDGLPRSRLENSTNDEITMSSPVKLAEIVIPKQIPKHFRQLNQIRLR